MKGYPSARRYWPLPVVLLLALAFWLSWPRQEAARPRTIGVVSLTAVDADTLVGFKTGLAALGYQEGRDLRYLIPPPAGRVERLDAILAGHLAAGVDLLFVSSTPASLAARRATAGQGIPVVFAPVNDPVNAGLIQNLKAPGGNLTGIRLPRGDALRLQWLVRIAPGVKRILVPYTPHDLSARESLRQMQAVSAALGVELLPQPVRDARAITQGLRELPPRLDAILLPRDSSVEAHIADYVAVARARRLPLCAPSLAQVQAGALLSYGFVHQEIGQQAARLADQILRGVPPGDLPVETADNYLAINLATARAIGLTLPDDALRLAHVVVREGGAMEVVR